MYAPLSRQRQRGLGLIPGGYSLVPDPGNILFSDVMPWLPGSEKFENPRSEYLVEVNRNAGRNIGTANLGLLLYRRGTRLKDEGEMKVATELYASMPIQYIFWENHEQSMYGV